MKTILFIMGIFICGMTYSQEYPKNAFGEIEFTEVITVENTSERLFVNAKEWVSRTFGDYKGAVHIEDNENKMLVIKGVTSIQYSSSIEELFKYGDIEYTVIIECRDGRYRYRMNEITIQERQEAVGIVVKSDKRDLLYYDMIINRANERIITVAGNDPKLKKQLVNIINESVESKDKEYAAIMHVLESLKYSMSINDDF